MEVIHRRSGERLHVGTIFFLQSTSASYITVQEEVCTEA